MVGTYILLITVILILFVAGWYAYTLINSGFPDTPQQISTKNMYGFIPKVGEKKRKRFS